MGDWCAFKVFARTYTGVCICRWFLYKYIAEEGVYQIYSPAPEKIQNSFQFNHFQFYTSFCLPHTTVLEGWWLFFLIFIFLRSSLNIGSVVHFLFFSKMYWCGLKKCLQCLTFFIQIWKGIKPTLRKIFTMSLRIHLHLYCQCHPCSPNQ